MKIKQFVNDIWDVGRSDCWTSDDTSDFAGEIVESLLKQMKINLNFINVYDELEDLVRMINNKISQTLESALEEWGDPWSGDREDIKFRKTLTSRGKKNLTKVIREQIVFATKFLKKHLEAIKKLIESNKRRDNIRAKMDLMYDSIYRVPGPKRKRVQVNVKTLENLLSTLRNYIKNEEDEEKDKLLVGNKK
jgi:hypothetical protein